MPDSALPRRRSTNAARPTRRHFIAGASAAGASTAGAALLGAAAEPEGDPAAQTDVAVTPRRPAHAHPPRPTCVAATSDPNRVVTCDDKGGVFLRTLQPAGKTAFKKLRKNKASYVAASRAGDRVLTASFDGVVMVSDLATQKRLAVFDDHLAETGPNTEVWTVVVNGNGTMALSASNTGEIRYWDVGQAHTVAGDGGDGEPVAALAFLPGETAFLAGRGDGKMVRWTIAGGALTADAATFDNDTPHQVNSIAVFDNNGLKAVTGSLDARVRIWDLNDPSAPIATRIHRHFVWRVAASPDGTRFASASEDHTVQFFDIAGNTIRNPVSVPDGVMGVVFVSDRRVVYTTGSVADPQVLFVDL